MALQTLGTHEQGWELESLKTINKVSGQKQTSVSIHTFVSPTSVPFQKDLFIAQYCVPLLYSSVKWVEKQNGMNIKKKLYERCLTGGIQEG